MKLTTVCLTVAAISFAECEFNVEPKTPIQMWHHSPVHTKQQKKLQQDVAPTIATKEQFASTVLTKDFRLLKHIYDECKTKVSKRLKRFASELKGSSELKTYFWSLCQCVKVYGFRALDRMLQDNFIPVSEYAYFIRDGANGTEGPSARSAAEDVLPPMKDYAARVLPRGWTALLYDRIDALLRTHSLKFRTEGTFLSQGRSRRRDHRMFAMLVMGFMIMTSILIPMGFQFLTVLGGKSLLLAKMALIMSAISGLKKIATSNVGYGFYHTAADAHPHDHPHHGFHEKHLQLHSQNYNPMQAYN